MWAGAGKRYVVSLEDGEREHFSTTKCFYIVYLRSKKYLHHCNDLIFWNFMNVMSEKMKKFEEKRK